MLAYLVKFFFGVVILLLSTQVFVKLSEKLSNIFRISPLIIGLTVISFGTSLPELAVSVIASADGDVGLATGNIIGSNIVNVFLIFSAAILIGKLRIGTSKTQKNVLMLLLATAFFIFVQKISVFPALFGGILISLSAFFTFLEYRWGIIGRTHEDIFFIRSLKKEKVTPDLVFGILLSIIGVAIGGFLVVTSMEELSVISGYSTTLFGLTLTAVATSLPELFTTIQSQKEDQEKMTIGNILGSSLFNLLFIGGLVNIVGGTMEMPKVEMIFLVVSILCLFGILSFYKGKYVPKWVGLALLAMFFIYIYVLSFSSPGHLIE